MPVIMQLKNNETKTQKNKTITIEFNELKLGRDCKQTNKQTRKRLFFKKQHAKRIKRTKANILTKQRVKSINQG